MNRVSIDSELHKVPATVRPVTVRQAFTLLEVILALALTGLIVAAIAMAVHLHLVMLTKQQDSIEQSHVGRNVLEIISVDIRAAWQYKPYGVDTVDINEAADNVDPASAADAIAGAGGTEAPDLTGGAGGLGGDSAAADEAEPTFGDPIPHPGFYGTSQELMFNINRLPRLDQFNPYIRAGDKQVTIPSDMKTTSYFLDRSGKLDGDQLTEDTLGGLYRRQLPHAVASYANLNGYRLSAKATTELLATEVVDLSFRYFDGEEWSDEWDSDEMGGFPVAVEITIIVDSRRKEGVDDLPEYTGYDEEYMQIFKKVVHLPLAEILSAEELQAIEDSQSSVADAAENSGNGGDR